MKKQLFKKTIACALAVAMTVSLAACGKSSSGGGQANVSGLDENGEVVEITFPLAEKAELSFITSAPANSTQDPNEREIFKRLEEATNVHINWTCFVEDQFNDKKNLALSQAKSLPDGLFNAGMSNYDLLRYAKQGVIIPLEDLIDNYMPNLQAVFEKYPEYRTMSTAPEGHIYAFPWIEQLGEGKEAIQSIGGMPFINKKWLDELGLEVPTTTDELEQVLIAFKEKDPAGNGQTIPMTFIINDGDQDFYELMGAFGEGYGDVPDHIAVTNDKKVIWTATQDGYKEAIAWLHKLYEQGLMDPEGFTQDWGTYGEEGKFNIFEMSENENGEPMLKHMDLGTESPVEVRQAQSVNGPLAILNDYYGTYVTCPDDAQYRLDWIREIYVPDMIEEYVYPNVFMSQEDTDKLNQYETDLKKYTNQMRADWIMNGGVEEGWDAYIQKLDEYGLQEYLEIRQKYLDDYFAAGNE